MSGTLLLVDHIGALLAPLDCGGSGSSGIGGLRGSSSGSGSGSGSLSRYSCCCGSGVEGACFAKGDEGTLPGSDDGGRLVLVGWGEVCHGSGPAGFSGSLCIDE